MEAHQKQRQRWTDRLKILPTLTYVHVIVTCLDYVNIPPQF